MLILALLRKTKQYFQDKFQRHSSKTSLVFVGDVVQVCSGCASSLKLGDFSKVSGDRLKTTKRLKERRIRGLEVVRKLHWHATKILQTTKFTFTNQLVVQSLVTHANIKVCLRNVKVTKGMSCFSDANQCSD